MLIRELACPMTVVLIQGLWCNPWVPQVKCVAVESSLSGWERLNEGLYASV